MQAWRTVRVFISSTFRDMHTERDQLVKYVFPALRERCRKLHLHLVDVDLRWGVTEEEAEQGRALEICLKEIRYCRPFFIGLLGERYGWVPQQYEIPDEPEFDWVRGVEPGQSITAMEIYHGVLNNPDMARHAFFYFRNPAFLDDLPESKRADVLPENEEAREKLARLKQAIRDAAKPVFEDYPCHYDGLRLNWPMVQRGLPEAQMQLLGEIAEDGLVDIEEYAHLDPVQQGIIDKHSVVGLAGLGAPEGCHDDERLEYFGDRVLEDLWSAIQAEYGEEEVEREPLEVERAQQAFFIETRSQLFVGRQTELAQLHAYVESEIAQPLLVSGLSGCGKSALLAKFCAEYAERHSDDFLVAHFIGASPDSTDLRRTLLRICQEVARRFGIEAEIPDDFEGLRVALPKLLEQASTKGRPVLVLDALDQLDPAYNAHALHWFPLGLPANVRIMASCIRRDGTRQARGNATGRSWPSSRDLECGEGKGADEASIAATFNRIASGHPEMHLGPLRKQDSASIVLHKLDEYRKKLSNQQMEVLLAKPAAAMPLYLLAACEELRLFADFDQLDTFVEELAGTIPALCDSILARAERDHGKALVRNGLSLIACSRRGLLETELRNLLGINGTPLPQATWARLYRTLEFYLLPSGADSEGLINFFHQQFGEAVRLRYSLSDDGYAAGGFLRDCHRRLAHYFRHRGFQSSRCLAELPFHLTQAHLWDDLERLLCDLRFVQAKCGQADAGTGRGSGGVCDGVYDLQQDYEFALVAVEHDMPREMPQDVERCRGSLRLLFDAVTKQAHLISACPDVTFPQVFSYLSTSRREAVQPLLKRATSQRQEPWLLMTWNRLATEQGFIRVLSGLGHVVQSIAWACDGQLLVATSRPETGSMYYGLDLSTRSWDVGTGKLVFVYPEPGHYLACWHDGIVVARSDLGLDRWMLLDFQGRLIEEDEPNVACMRAICASRRRLFCAEGTAIRFWESDSVRRMIRQEPALVGELPAEVDHIATDAEGALVIGASGNYLRGWRPRQRAPLFELNSDSRVSSVACSPDGRRIAVLYDSGKASVFRMAENRPVKAVELDSAQGPIQFTADGRILICSGFLYDSDTGELVGSLDVVSPVNLSISPDGLLLALSQRGGRDVLLYDLRCLVEARGTRQDYGLRGPSGIPSGHAVFYSDCNALVTGARSGTVQLHLRHAGRACGGSVMGAVEAAAVCGDVVAVCSEGDESMVTVLERTDSDCLRLLWKSSLSEAPHGAWGPAQTSESVWAHSLVFSPDAQYLLWKGSPRCIDSPISSCIRVWRATSGDPTNVLRVKDRGAGLLVSADGSWVWHGETLLDTTTGETLADMPGLFHSGSYLCPVSAVALSADGELLLTGDTSGLTCALKLRELWSSLTPGFAEDRDAREEFLRLKERTRSGHIPSFGFVMRPASTARSGWKAVTALAISPGNRFAAVALGEHGLVEIWALWNKARVAACYVLAPVRRMDFAADGDDLYLCVAGDAFADRLKLVGLHDNASLPTNHSEWRPRLWVRPIHGYATPAPTTWISRVLQKDGTPGQRRGNVAGCCPNCHTSCSTAQDCWTVCKKCRTDFLVVECPHCHSRVATHVRVARGPCPYCGQRLIVRG